MICVKMKSPKGIFFSIVERITFTVCMNFN